MLKDQGCINSITGCKLRDKGSPKGFNMDTPRRNRGQNGKSSSANSKGVEPASEFLQVVQFYREFRLRLSGFHPVRDDSLQKPVSSFHYGCNLFSPTARSDRSAMICPRQRREVIAQRRSVPANGEK
jgi:hypothetical protein